MSAHMRGALYKPAGQTLFLSGPKVGFRSRFGYNRMGVDEPDRPACAAVRTIKDCM